MKKTYTKPEMSFESFELSTSVASGCSVLANHSDENQCYIIESGKKLFVSSYICSPFEQLSDSGCYHITAQEGVFTS